MIETFLFIATALTALGITGAIHRYGARISRLDIPNERSSHATPTARGGGIAIVFVVLTTLVVLCITNTMESRDALSIGFGSLIVALVGQLDDRGRLTSARWRLLGHLIAAIIIVVGLHGLPTLPVFGRSIDIGVVGSFLAVVYLVWLLNLFNFMDGIDGLTGIESLTTALCGAYLAWDIAPQSRMWFTPLAVAGAALGFLIFNWPPAKIFIGDVGSGFIGIVFGALSIQAAHSSPQLGWSWVILMGVFVVDATVTLVRRALRGQRVYIAHRSHAYQRVALRVGRHSPVSLGVGAINLFWLFPMALLVAHKTLDGFGGVLIAYTPLVIAAVFLGAGVSETESRQ
ncbi:MAG: glycosyltransferase family 4 protein [Ilumatobacteraceae bacterium]